MMQKLMGFVNALLFVFFEKGSSNPLGKGSSNTHGSSICITEIVKYSPVCSLGETKPFVITMLKNKYNQTDRQVIEKEVKNFVQDMMEKEYLANEG